MKKLLCTLTMFVSLYNIAQITLTAADIPVAGTRILNVNDLNLIGINYGLPGTNQTYDLTGLVSSTIDSTNFISTSATAYGSVFPASNLTMLNLPDTNYTFLKTTASSVEMVGMLMANPLGTGPDLNFVADSPIMQMSFPATYQTNFTDVGTLNSNVIPFYMLVSPSPLTYVDSFKVSYTVDITSNIDGWGTLTTPVGTFNVLRQKVTTVNTSSSQTYMVVEIAGFPVGQWVPLEESVTTTITYTYLTNSNTNTPLILAEITTDGNDVVTAARYSIVDLDCNDIYYVDNDLDGFGAGASQTYCENPGNGFSTLATDCDDNNAMIKPTATDIPNNGIDEDCVGGDETQVIDNDGDGVSNSTDCDDNNAAVSTTSIAGTFTVDNATFCENGSFTVTLTNYAGSIQWQTSDDNGQTWNPTGDTQDNFTVDVNGTWSVLAAAFVISGNCPVDTSNAILLTSLANQSWYADNDNDGYGDVNSLIVDCVQPTGYVLNSNDCNDANAAIFMGATDIPNNGIDEDCSGADETQVLDNDGDGADNTTDCNDNDAAINPNAAEICDGIDNNCDGNIDEGQTFTVYYVDADMDGFGTGTNGTTLCSNPGVGFSDMNSDCNDANASINPNATEICDQIDNDCDGLTDEGLASISYYSDTDGDDFGTGNVMNLCSNPGAGFTTVNGDCNDNNAAIHPNASETCDGIDNNCDGTVDEGLTTITYYLDDDMDSFGAPGAGIDKCADPGAGFSTLFNDCNDANAGINPSATEIADNGIDEDCDGLDLLSGLEENSSTILSIYPNPGNELVTITFQESVKQATVKLISTIGEVLVTQNVSNTNNSIIQTTDLSSGVYYIEINLEGQTKMYSWVKK